MSIFGQKGNGLLVAVRGKQKQVDHLRNEVEELKHQLDAERAKNDALKAKITAYQKNDLSAVKKVEARYEEQLRILNEQIRAYEQMKPELERLRNFFFEQNIGADESDVQAVESDKQEEIAKYKIITVGGHEQLRKNIKDAYPSIMVLGWYTEKSRFSSCRNFRLCIYPYAAYEPWPSMPSYYDCFQKVLYHYSHQTRKLQTFSRKRRVRIFCFWRRAPPHNKSIRSAWPGCFSSGAVRCGCLFFMPRPLS